MATKDLYGLKNAKGTYMIPKVSDGKLGLISPEELKAINKRIDEISNKLKEIDPNFTPEKPNEDVSISIVKMDELPDISLAKTNAIYAIPNSNPNDDNRFEEFIVVDGEWEAVGNAIENAVIDDNDITNLFN